MIELSTLYAAQVAPSLSEHYDAIIPMFTTVCTAFVAVCTWILLGMKKDITKLYEKSDVQESRLSHIEGEHAARVKIHMDCGQKGHDAYRETM